MPSPTTFRATIARFARHLPVSRALDQDTIRRLPSTPPPNAVATVPGFPHQRLPSLALRLVSEVKVWGLWATDEEEEQGNRKGGRVEGSGEGRMKDPSKAPLYVLFYFFSLFN